MPVSKLLLKSLCSLKHGFHQQCKYNHKWNSSHSRSGSSTRIRIFLFSFTCTCPCIEIVSMVNQEL